MASFDENAMIELAESMIKDAKEMRLGVNSNS